MQTIRLTAAFLAAPALAITGFRFSKDYRWGISRFHRAVYVLVNTVAANSFAETIRPRSVVRSAS